MRYVTLRPEGKEFDNWQKKAGEARNILIEEWKSEREAAVREGRAIY